MRASRCISSVVMAPHDRRQRAPERTPRGPGRSGGGTMQRRLIAFTVSLLPAIGMGLAAQARQEATPRFRTSVDVVQMDVTVLDENRQPVHGLTAADFIVTE